MNKIAQMEKLIQESIDNGTLPKVYEELDVHEVLSALLDVVDEFEDVVGVYVKSIGETYIKEQE